MSNERPIVAFLGLLIVISMFTHTSFTSAASDDDEDLIPNIEVRKFSMGKDYIEYDLTQMGDKSADAIELQKGLQIKDAYFYISGYPRGSTYPRNVTVDVGDDFEYDWAFKGTGYGYMGYQKFFSDDTDNKTIDFDSPRNDSSCKFLLPKGAKIKSASVNLTGYGDIRTHKIQKASWRWGPLFYYYNSVRFQILYRANELGGNVGTIDKIYFRVDRGGTTTYSNLRIYLCPTPRNDLTGNFNSNYGGVKPTLVLSKNSYRTSASGGWLVFDLDNVYFYNGHTNLLVEVRYSGKSGTNYYTYYRGQSFYSFVYYYSSGAGSGWRYTRTWDIKFDFIYKFDLKVDIGGDNLIEYANNSIDWTGADIDIKEGIQDYIDAENTHGNTDEFGNEMIAVPVKLIMGTNGRIYVKNLNITYDYTGKVSGISGRRLPSVINSIVPDEPSTENMTIIVKIYSDTPCKMRIHDLYISAKPPPHPPTIVSYFPDQTSVAMMEKAEMSFSINTTDIYGNGVTYRWHVNGILIENWTESWYVYKTSYEDSGKKAITVSAYNGQMSVEFTWNISVKNVNREPIILDWWPREDAEILENESIEFGIVVDDPDNENIIYKWYLNMEEVPEQNENTYTFNTDYTSAGQYEIKVVATDPYQAKVSKKWILTVKNVNLPPVITQAEPEHDEIIINEGETVRFNVKVRDPDGDMIQISWYLDGEKVVDGPVFEYTADYDSAGGHIIKVIASDGKESTEREWEMLIDDINREPSVSIGSPDNFEEFLTTDSVVLRAGDCGDPDGDSLEYIWECDGKILARGKIINTTFEAGDHEIKLTVRDGRGGENSTSVTIIVRFVKIDVTIEIDKKSVSEGKRVSIRVILKNNGDGIARNLLVNLMAGDDVIDTYHIDELKPKAEMDFTSEYKVKKGENNIAVLIGDDKWTETIEGKSVTESEGMLGQSYFIPLALIILIVGIISGAVVLTRKKKMHEEEFVGEKSETRVEVDYYPQFSTSTPMEIPPPEPYAAQPGYTPQQTAWHAPAQYDQYSSGYGYPYSYEEYPGQQQQPTAQPQYDMSPAVAPPLTSYTSYPSDAQDGHLQDYVSTEITASSQPSAETSEEVMDEKTLRKKKKAENIMRQAEAYLNIGKKKGVDVGYSERMLRLARSFMNAGEYEKSINYSRKADKIIREKIKRKELEEIAKEEFCQSCGSSIDPSWRVCPSCGEVLR